MLFENIVKDYFFNYLHNYYTKANKIKKALEHKNEFAKKVNDYNTKKENNDFIDKAEETGVSIPVLFNQKNMLLQYNCLHSLIELDALKRHKSRII